MDIRWALEARADLWNIADRYAHFDAELPAIMLHRIDAATAPLRLHPHMGESAGRHVRKWSVRGTPFVLLYRVYRDRVEITRVVHASMDWRRDPE